MAIVPLLAVLAGLLLLCAGLVALWLRLREEGSDGVYTCRNSSREGSSLYWDLDFIALAQATGRDLYSDQSLPPQPEAPRFPLWGMHCIANG